MALLKDVDRVKKTWLSCRDRFLSNIDFARTKMCENYRRRATEIFLKFELDK
jgi:hypothetical protein